MFFGEREPKISIRSVHHLAWERRDVDIPPKTSFAISYRAEGESRLCYQGELISAARGDIFYFPKGASYHIEAGRERLWSVLFDAEGDMPDTIMKITPANRSFIESLFSDMYKVWSGRECGYYARTMSYFYRIIAEIERESEAVSERRTYLKLKPALSRIYSGYMSPELSVAQLARDIGVSETYVRRIFKDELGARPLDFINGVRVSYAKEYLESGLYSVEAAAESAGFSDAKYFATVFKRIAGMSPSEYVKAHS